MTQANGPMRVPPVLTDLNRDYWTGGFAGELRIRRCRSCRSWQHPPATICRSCWSRDIAAEPVSGKATVEAFTINHQRWSAAATQDPYVIAIVELAEQHGLRQTTNIINCDPEAVGIGMPVRVVFQTLDEVSLPLFEPVDSAVNDDSLALLGEE